MQTIKRLQDIHLLITQLIKPVIRIVSILLRQSPPRMCDGEVDHPGTVSSYILVTELILRWMAWDFSLYWARERCRGLILWVRACPLHRLFTSSVCKGLDPVWSNGAGLARAQQANPFIIIPLRRSSVNQRDNLTANKLHQETGRKEKKGGLSSGQLGKIGI